ncbi:PREDICTED: basic salivary proline-rich protein 4-like [Vollenhovia emeryi]|uniref:basic salivary proline-rich protein 4-like n=1 Tax=Vollenhovia emeryi TaxID=411798 RepID=UPI0005F4D299|nr:PREDICTED: basic salivary proline-rich protein 4-like [Vollenhovia emeryi]
MPQSHDEHTATIRASTGQRPHPRDRARAPRARRGHQRPPAHSPSPRTRPPAAPRHKSNAPLPTPAAARGDPADRRHQCPGSSAPRGTPPYTRGPPEGHALPAEDAERGGDPTRHGANDNMVTILPRPTAAFTPPRGKKLAAFGFLKSNPSMWSRPPPPADPPPTFEVVKNSRFRAKNRPRVPTLNVTIHVFYV